jgi:hypothetical protein
MQHDPILLATTTSKPFSLKPVGISRAGPEGVPWVRPHRAPKNRRPLSHWMLAFFFVKSIYCRHKYVKSDALSSYRLVSFILLN